MAVTLKRNNTYSLCLREYIATINMFYYIERL